MVSIFSFPITKETWAITTDCTLFPEQLELFTGQSMSDIDVRSTVENLVIGISLYEPRTSGDYSFWLQNVLDFCKNSRHFPKLKNVYILYDTAYIGTDSFATSYNVYKIKVPFLFLRSELSKKRSPMLKSKPWDKSNGKILYLIGDIRNRPHKFPVLYEFYINNSLDILEYTLNTDFGFWEQNIHPMDVRHWGSTTFMLNIAYDLKLSHNDFVNLYKKLERRFSQDSYRSANKMENGINVLTYHFPNEWNDASLIIANESSFSIPVDPEFRNSEDFPFTEKIWKPILTKKPFMSNSEFDGVETTLEKMGFRTFSKYTDYSKKISLPMDMRHATVRYYASTTYKRSKNFIQNMDKYRNEINDDIEHNYQHWNTLLQISWDSLYSACPPLSKISKEDFCDSFMTTPISDVFTKYLQDQNV